MPKQTSTSLGRRRPLGADEFSNRFTLLSSGILLCLCAFTLVVVSENPQWFIEPETHCQALGGTVQIDTRSGEYRPQCVIPFKEHGK